MNPETAAVAERLLEEGILSTLDVRFGRLILRLAGSGGLPLFLAAALTRRAVGRGHVCLDLAEIGEQRLMEGEGGFLERVCPDADSLRKTLMQNPMVGDGSGIAPLVLDSAGRLYLHRLWECETFLARALLHRSGRFVPPADLLVIKAAVDLLFPRPHGGLPDPQAAAAYLAATGRFCIISGGPGTGKTTTAGKLLALLVSLQMQPIRIALAAPTGKAAARLKESIRWVKGSLSVGEAVKSVIPEEAATLHRLLGSTPGKAGFRYTPENPLPVDWVLVDEASMVDLTLMAGLFRAVPSHAGIVLLGDRDQLASVETGTVFGDICSRERSPGIAPEVARGLEATFGLEKGSVLTRAAGKKGLSDCIVTLDTPHRFSAASGIARLSQAVRDGDADGTLRTAAIRRLWGRAMDLRNRI